MEHETFAPQISQETHQFEALAYFGMDNMPSTIPQTEEQFSYDYEWIADDPHSTYNFTTERHSQLSYNLEPFLEREFLPLESWLYQDPMTTDNFTWDFTTSSPSESQYSFGSQDQFHLLDMSSPSGSDQIARSLHTERTAESQSTFSPTAENMCKFCARRFAKKYLLTKHERLHTKPIKCVAPGYKHRTASKRDMRRHVEVHHAMQSAQKHVCLVTGCRYAERGFKRKDHLMRHMKKIHS